MNLYLILFVILNIFSACNSYKGINNYTVSKYQKVDAGYQYSKDILKHQGKTYKPIISSEYLNDSLVSVAVYKSEGKISYTNAELKGDPLFKEMLNLPEIRKVELKADKVIDNGTSYQIVEFKNDSIFCINKDTLFLYNIH